MARDILCEKAYQGVRQYVVANQQNGNTKINQSELSNQLGISRTPIVKALHMLESEGLVDNIPNKGFYIHALTLRELSELFMLRQSLEMISGAYICQYGTEKDFQEMEEIFAPFVGADPIDYDRYFEADKQFHSKLFNLCDNRLMHRLNDQMQIMERIFSIGLFRKPKETLGEHLQMLQIFRQRDEIKAQEMMHMHTDLTRRYLENLYRQLKTIGVNPDTILAKDVAFH